MVARVVAGVEILSKLIKFIVVHAYLLHVHCFLLNLRHKLKS